MASGPNTEDLGSLKPGDPHYKAYVGPPLAYDLMGALQFNYCIAMGLRDEHRLLDIGCGSLRLGKLMIPFLQKGNYYGIEPNTWLIREGIEHELGEDCIALKAPVFSNTSDFDLRSLNARFDFIIAQSIFSHASQSQITRCLSEANTVLKENGLLIATFLLGVEDNTESGWIYPDCIKYNRRTVERMIGVQGLKFIRTQWPHPFGQTWYLIFHPDNEVHVREKIRNAENLYTQTRGLMDTLTGYPLINNRLTRYLLRKARSLYFSPGRKR